MPNWGLIGAMVMPNLGGWGGALSMIGQLEQPDGKAWYQTLIKPKWTPPNWLFGPTWIFLYSAMGYASYAIYQDCGGFTEAAMMPLSLYGAQLFMNWTWTPIFFKVHALGWALGHMLILDILAVANAMSFFEINRLAGWLLMPYLGWLAFATLLNHAVWKMNKHPGHTYTSKI